MTYQPTPRSESRGLWSPPPDLTVSEWADEHRQLSPESSAEPGKWYTARAEYQRGIMEAMSEPGIETVVAMTSSQVGKTEIVNNVVGYFIDQDPSPILCVQPTLDMGKTWSKDRLAPMVRDTVPLQGRVKDSRARDSGNTVLHKTFPGGHITITGANSAAGLSSRPIRVVVLDEVDRYPPSAGTEGDPVRLATKRTTAFWNRKILMVSTPTVKGFSRIETAWEGSDQRRYWVPCPHCGEYQTLRWAQVVWPEGEPEAAVYQCEHCEEFFGDADKLRMVREGEWRAESESRGVAGFHLNELYSPWRGFGEIADDFIEAKRGGPETLKAWVNTSLGESWEETGDSVDAVPLFARREDWGETLPTGVVILTAGVDVQDDRLELEVVGWGVGEESWSIAYEVLWGDPARPKVWTELDEFLGRRWEHPAASLPIAAVCIDSGGHHTDAVYKYCKGRHVRRIWAIKGIGGEGVPLVRRPKKTSKAKRGSMLVLVGVDTAKESVFARLQIEEPGPGYCHFPMDRDEEYFAQLTGEKVVRRFVKGWPRREWHKTRPRNEALDCRAYAYAALGTLAANLVRLARKLVDAPAAAEEAEKPEAPQPKQRRARRTRGSGWVNGWK